MTLDLPTRPAARDPQALAADPALSAFVTANAGSGKTKTLIDRVARLLLAGARPETILCVTYTKAAASEMQRRLFDVLGEWSVLPDAALAAKIEALEGRAYSGAELSGARTLFAKALETPGGLKIQTIHAFCEKLLRRFPLEAGVSPAFRVVDEAAAAGLSASARGMVARHALNAGGPVADAYARLSVSLDFGSFEGMFPVFESCRGELSAFFAREGGLAGAVAWAWAAAGVEPGATPEAVAAEAMAALRPEIYQRAARLLEAGSKTDQGCAEALAAIARAPEGQFERALALFFTKANGREGEGTPKAWISNSAKLKADPTVQHLLLAEQSRLEQARDRARAARVAADTEAALTLAHAYLAAYKIEKDSAGVLDFADLIHRTCDLLSKNAAAAWVLYKLDGGIDHILLDEAQDTAPEQWTILDRLTAEFFAGAGARGQGALRGLFVVGDQKQSIYSFQGARPELLREKLEFHRDRATGAGYRFEQVDLLTSWRSTPQVLRFVDAVFAPAELAAAIQPGLDEAAVRHEVAGYRAQHPGCVDVWDLEVERPGEKREAWDAPLDLEREDSANRRLARRIAREVKDLIERGDAVWDKKRGAWRAANAGDVLILVRRRKALFEEIIRALKQADLPVAGADRLALSGHIAFDDLLALARFALFPLDELTLAALLKSPFCGMDDERLYALAHGRTESLWRVLQRRAEEAPDWAEAHGVLARALEAARAQRPFEFYAGFLDATGVNGVSMRRRLLQRLGAEAEDVIDEFLNQVLAAELRGVHDLERLAAELSALDLEVKREMEADRPEVRVMTAHGAKGLEAPIVFLPETTVRSTGRGSPLLPAEGGFLWCASAARDCRASAAARAARAAREDAEALRLLYVGLTRARDRLVLCGRISARDNPEKLGGWWGAIRDSLSSFNEIRQLEGFRRLGPDPLRLPPEGASSAPASPPAWLHRSAPAEAFGRYASPSDLGEGARAPAPSPLAASGGLGRFRRGDLIHRLLQLLPDLPPAERAEGARRLLDREPDLTEAQRAEMAAAALSVLEDPRFAEVFGEGSRPEVAVAGTAAALPEGLRISGRIDRLVVLPDRVLVADFKTNRPSPDRIEDADPAYLRQMALYAAVLGEVFPGRRIEAALVWTYGPKLMPVPENLMVQALAELRRLG